VSFLLLPLFVSAVFFLGVFLRDLRGDFRERTHQFEDLDPWEDPSRGTRLDVDIGARRHRARDFIRCNLLWWLAVPASISVVLILPYVLLSRPAMGTERHWSEPRLTLMVVPFEAVGDDPSQRSVANTLNEGLKRELATWKGLVLVAVETASVARRQTDAADERGAWPRPLYAFEGSVVRSNETVSIQARLYNARTATDVWSAQLNSDPADRSNLLAELTSGLAGVLDDELAR